MKKSVEVCGGHLRPVIEIGWTQNGRVPVRVETESDGRVFVYIGEAALHIPTPDLAFACALSWVTGKVRAAPIGAFKPEEPSHAD